MAYVLWQRHLKHNPQNPQWPDRDRFVLSAGHGCMLLYCLLHLTGYDLTLDDLKASGSGAADARPPRDLRSRRASRRRPARSGRAPPTRSAWRSPSACLAAPLQPARPHDRRPPDLRPRLRRRPDGGHRARGGSLAGHLRLGQAHLPLRRQRRHARRPASLAFTEDVGKRYEAYGWHVQHVDGRRHRPRGDRRGAERGQGARPSGRRIDHRADDARLRLAEQGGNLEAHGSPLGADEVARTKKALGWDSGGAVLRSAGGARALPRGRRARQRGARRDWEQRVRGLRAGVPRARGRVEASRTPASCRTAGTRTCRRSRRARRTRRASAAGKALNAIAARVPELFGGDADLGGSTKTTAQGRRRLRRQTGAGRNIHLRRARARDGRRSPTAWRYHGGVRAFAATFFCFSDYMRPSVRLAALNELPVIFVWTHDSIGLGEDGPTHQPVEHLMSLRAMPNMRSSAPATPTRRRRPGGPRCSHGGAGRPRALAPEAAGARPGQFAPASGLARGALRPRGRDRNGPATRPHRHGLRGLPGPAAPGSGWRRRASRPGSSRCPRGSSSRRSPKPTGEEVLPPGVRARLAIEAGASFGW